MKSNKIYSFVCCFLMFITWLICYICFEQKDSYMIIANIYIAAGFIISAIKD
jgi:hypothetical protein